MRKVSVGVLLVAALVLPGCRHATKPAPAEGRSSFTFVDALTIGPKKPDVRLEEEKEPLDALVLAWPIEPLAKPVYPKVALAGQADAALVGATISVDVEGNVTDVGPSMVCFTTPGPFAAEFRAAVEEAVKQWKFVPAKRRHLEPARAEDGSTYWRASLSEKVPASFDVAFTFTADGDVTREAAK